MQKCQLETDGGSHYTECTSAYGSVLQNICINIYMLRIAFFLLLHIIWNALLIVVINAVMRVQLVVIHKLPLTEYLLSWDIIA